MIAAADLAAPLGRLASVGRDGRGVTRLAWTPELAAAEDWFAGRARDTGLRVERDPAGNLWAVPDAPPPWWAMGSHLDTVREGGDFDGALGVAAAFEVACRSTVPVAVIAFADEEGARFNTPTFGSRALAGRLDLAVLDRRDDDGVRLADALAGFGVDPDGPARAPSGLERLRGFLEIHIDQSRAVAGTGAPAAVASRLAARVRVRADLRGRASHAGTTPMAERADALAAAARLIVEATTPREPGLVATATRIDAGPGALTTVPARVAVWLDARAPQPAALDAWRGRLAAVPVAPVDADLEVQARSDGVEFDPGLRAALRDACAAAGGTAPEQVCFAGHDAGILAERVPAAMLLVRNAAGISHAPEEHVDLADAAWACEVALRALEALG